VRRLLPLVVTLLLVAGACGDDDPAVERRASRSLRDQIDLVDDTLRFLETDAIAEERAPAILQAIEELEIALLEAEDDA
jgi:hypothetical protein